MSVPESLASLHKSFIESGERLRGISTRFRDAVAGPHDEICVLAVGSYGRREASVSVSDFEWITIYDGSRVAAAEATLFQANVTAFFAAAFGRERLSINKTFGNIVTIDDLTTNVGGEADSNRALTYRMLVLCEGMLVNQSAAYDRLVGRLAHTYGSSHTAGHRLLSLATDIARYWRTLRIDYKHKVDERSKPWAVRALKLRSARRLAYFSSALHLVGKGPRIYYGDARSFNVETVKTFMVEMAGNPVERLFAAAEATRADGDRLGRLLTTYDEVHRLLGDPSIRADLEALAEENRMENENFVRIRHGCAEMHQAIAELVMTLPRPHQQEIVEMFLL
jgi:hypothetical protein